MSPPSSPPRSATNGTASKETLATAKTWDIFCPPPSNTFKGAIMPNVFSRVNRRRRLSIEIHRIYTGKPTGASESSPTAGPGGLVKAATQVLLSSEVETGQAYYEECYLRMLSPRTNAVRKTMKFKHGAGGEEVSMIGDFDDEASVASTIVGNAEFADTDNLENDPNYAGWKPKYKLPLAAVAIKKVRKRVVTCVNTYGEIKHTRDFIFDTEEEASAFAQMIEAQKEAEEKRALIKMQHNLGNIKLPPDEELTLLIEIVSGTDLPVADISSSDPLVACYFNGKEIHRTKHISKNLNPVWTLKKGSLFLLEVSSKELFKSDGLVCEVLDFDKLGDNEKLGAIVVPPKTLYTAKGERLPFPLQAASHGQSGITAKGSLAIRCRHATAHDQSFMHEFESSEGKKSQMATMIQKAQKTEGGKGTFASVVSKNRKREKQPDGSHITKYRARPYPDPKRKEETEWLTKEQVVEEVAKDSIQWVDTGSGQAARLFVEVLGCDDLPNLDTGGFLGNLTDSFVACVYEDTSVQTDVIDDSLNPRWLPWTRRAFIFHTNHSSSQLFLGVFDYDTGMDDHDLIGRVAVDVSNMRPNTLFTLTYNIYPTARMTDREAVGSVTVRIRMEVDDYRQLLTSCIEPPKPVYVNVKKKKDFKLIQYSCTGKYDMEAYSMKVITSYIDELSTYQNLLLYLEDAVVSLLLWRPQFEFRAFGTIFKLPLHSATAFLMSVFLVERPQLIPAFFFASIAWLLLATMFYRRHNPNPWRRCKSFRELFLALVTGKPGPSASIAAYENAEEAAQFEDDLRQRIEDAEAAAEQAAKEAEEAQEEYERELGEIGDTDVDIATKTGGVGISIDPFRGIMEPVQGYLHIAVTSVRYVRNVVVWEECYLAFWLTLGCLVLSVACLFVPWAFLLRWTSRIVVWTVFGPWMRLADIYYYKPIEDMTPAQRLEAKALAKLARQEATEAAALEARIERENATKLKVMKQYLFGKFILRVPVLKADRWMDVPLPQSKAEPFEPQPLALAELAMKEAGYRRTRIPGQHLEGVMIPTIEAKAFTEAPTGQPTKKHAVRETDAGAYVKIGSMVAGAAVITWAAVPLVANAAQSLLGAA